MPSNYTMTVLSNALPGRDDEFNKWFDNNHIHEMIALDEVKSAQRFMIAPSAPDTASPHKYLAVYDIETDDLVRLNARIGEEMAAGRMTTSDATDTSSVVITYFVAMGGKLVG